MKHEKTFEAIAKLKDIELELHRLKNALEIANKALDAKPAPVKVVAYDCVCGRKMYFESDRGVIGPKREWAGLTDEEKQKTWYEMQNIMGWYSFQEIAQAVEAKLKEKNQ